MALRDAESKARPSFISAQVTEARRYYFDLSPKMGRNAVVVCGGCERMRSDYVIDRADFPFLAIECVAEGTGVLELAGVSYKLTPGAAYAYGPSIAHRIRSNPAAPMLKYYIDFVGKSAEQLLAKSALAAARVVQLSSPQEVIDLFESLQREGMSETAFRQEICTALLTVLILKINQRAIPYGACDLRAAETYERAKRLIEQRFLTLRSVEETADACFIDPSYLARLFQRFGHVTPYHFLMRLKMSRAVTLLLDHRKLVKEVGEELGFADAFHFSRAFKRVYGISPERFLRHSHASHLNARSRSYDGAVLGSEIVDDDK